MMDFSMKTEGHNQKDNQQKSSGLSEDLQRGVGRSLKDNICMIAFVRIAVLIWSAGMLTLGYMGVMNKMDPTFVAAVFTSTLSTFGIDAQRKRDEESESRFNKSVNCNSSRSSSSNKST